MTRVGRANEMRETKEFMKLVADAEMNLILGAANLGVSNDEAIRGIRHTLNAEAVFPMLHWAVLTNPTVLELMPTLLGELKPLSG